MFNSLKKYLLTGLIVISPLAITSAILWFCFTYVDRILRYFFRIDIPGLGFLGGIALLILIGMITSIYIVRKTAAYVEKWIQRLPFIGDLYGTIKKLSAAFSNMDNPPFQHVVLIRIQDKGPAIPGFVTNNDAKKFHAATGQDMVNVFIPTVPNPTTGFLLAVPRDKITIMDMTINEGLKMVMTAGIVDTEENK